MTGPRIRYGVGAVANYFLAAGKRDRVPVTHLKLQKLISIAYGFYLATYGLRLFEERLEAWSFGPVVRELYHEFKRFGHYPITARATTFDHNDGRFYNPKVADPRAEAVLDFVWKQYGALSGASLVRLTHAPGTPWHKARASGKPLIDDHHMKEHYLELSRRLRQRSAAAAASRSRAPGLRAG